MSRRDKPEFAVIGLGRFGSSLALTLAEVGFNVLGVDNNPAVIQAYADQLTQAVTLDATDENALRDIDITAFDTVIVSMSQNFEGTILTTATLKSMGVRTIIVKALTERQRSILLRIGANRVVLPEVEAGQRLAHELTSTSMFSSLILSADYSITEVTVPRSLRGVTLGEADLRRRFGVTILALKRGVDVTVSPGVDVRLAADDHLVVLGANDDLTRLSELP